MQLKLNNRFINIMYDEALIEFYEADDGSRFHGAAVARPNRFAAQLLQWMREANQRRYAQLRLSIGHEAVHYLVLQ